MQFKEKGTVFFSRPSQAYLTISDTGHLPRPGILERFSTLTYFRSWDSVLLGMTSHPNGTVVHNR